LCGRAVDFAVQKAHLSIKRSPLPREQFSPLVLRIIILLRDRAADVPKITRGAKRNRQGVGTRLAPVICFASLAVQPLWASA